MTIASYKNFSTNEAKELGLCDKTNGLTPTHLVCLLTDLIGYLDNNAVMTAKTRAIIKPTFI